MGKFHRIYWSEKFDWKHYSKLYDLYCRMSGNYYTQSATVLTNLAKLSNSSNVVDLACGTGALTSEILKKYKGIKILAIDFSKDMLFYYRKKFFFTD